MIEKQFRIQKLNELNLDFNNKKVVLYGTGKNAEAILMHFGERGILALIDENNIGKYVFGKKIISFEEALFLKVDVIIIAAESQAERKIVDRIVQKCLSHNIQLINMYGINVINAIQDNIIQDINYKELTSESIKKLICDYEIVCFELMGVLCESSFLNKESMWRFLEKKFNINQFYKYRLNAEKQKTVYRPYDILDIYASYLVNTFEEKSEINKLCKLEEDLFLDSIIPKRIMLELLHYSINKGKNIYLISDLPYSRKLLNNLFAKIGLNKNISVIQENIGNKTFSTGLIREVLNDKINEKVLYLGNKNSLGYYISTSYGMKRCMIKSSWEYMQDLTELSVDEKSVSNENGDNFKLWVVNEFNSPFYQDNHEYNGKCFENITNENDCEAEKLNLIQFNMSQDIDKFERLIIPQYGDIDVSIIIPVYNYFEYTYACLQSIIMNTLKVKYEVIIGDDCSTDLTNRISEIVDGIRVVRNSKKLLFIRNCNNATKYARGKYIVFLNNDTQVKYNWLYPLSHLLDTDNTIGLVGSKLLFANGTVQEAGGLIFKNGDAANYGRGKNPTLPELNYVRDVDYISGASIIIRHDLWNEIGGFDEQFSPAYYGDSDLAFEVRNRGKRVVYQPASEVVCFERILNGKNFYEKAKKYQEINRLKLVSKWAKILINQSDNVKEEIFSAKDRKQKRKTILFISEIVPTYDRDAGSKTIMNYIKLFLEHNYMIKFWPVNMYPLQPYTMELQQLGVEVLYGKNIRKNMGVWLMQHQKDIDYAFVNYPRAGSETIDLLQRTSIKIRYYGHDLHYLRLERQYQKTDDKTYLKEANIFYKKEKEIIEKSEFVYYPSNIEVDIVKKTIKKENVKQISPYIYHNMDAFDYVPKDRNGIMFIGGIHAPNKDAVVWFLTEIYPNIYSKNKIPFYLVGDNHLSGLKQSQIEGIIEGIIDVGHVSDDELIDLYHKIRMVVIPLRFGAGIKGKVVDAMYHKIPIVSTSIGIEGISESKKCVKIADTADEFSEAVLDLYCNYDELIYMSKEYDEIIEKQFSADAAWKKIKDDF